MPPRRKKAVGGRRKAKQQQEDEEPVQKKTRSEGASVTEVLEQCRANPKSIRDHDESGTVSQLVWPTLVNLYDTKSTKTHGWDVSCQLLALLVSHAHQYDGRSAVGHQDPLEPCDNEDVNRAVIETLLGFLNATKEVDGISAEVLGFLICALGSDQSMFPRSRIVPTVLLWKYVPERRRELELRKSAGLRRKYNMAMEQDPDQSHCKWIDSWLGRFLDLLQRSSRGEAIDVSVKDTPIVKEGEQDDEEVLSISQQETLFLYRSLELLLDLLLTGDTRQYLVSYLDAVHFVVRSKLATKHRPETALMNQLLQRVYDALSFPLRGAHTPLSKTEVLSKYHARATILQKLCHRHYAEQLPEVIYAGVGLLCNGTYLPRALGGLSDDRLRNVLYRLRLIETKDDLSFTREFCLDVLIQHVTIPPYPLDQLKSFPLYPTEDILWNPHAIPSGRPLSSESPTSLALPKLQKQFLSYADYLLRNFELTRLESAYEIRQDLVHVVKRIKPVLRLQAGDENHETVATEFRGWARMSLELMGLRIVKVAPPRLGEAHPAEVVAEVTMDLEPCGEAIRREWDDLGEHDNLFLVGVDASQMSGAPAPIIHGQADRHVPDEEDSSFPRRFGVVAVRGAMILQVRDEEGRILSDPVTRVEMGSDRSKRAVGTKRVFRVTLDPVQYALDARSKAGTQIYHGLNLAVRRHGRENNFKAVLETIRGLTEGSGSITRVIPPWLQPLLLGYGEPDSASYRSDVIRSYALKTPGVSKPDAALDYGDTFLDAAHLRDSFPDMKCIAIDGQKKQVKNASHRCNYLIRVISSDQEAAIEATSYPFVSNVSGNPIRFTPVQVEAIRSGLSLGLSVIVGPPGTGKTDVAVQIIANLYHSFPTQRTLIVTHSNAALNDIFTKVMARGDIDERYLIRLGAGERELNIESSHDFTKTGRVAHSLARRAKLLEQVQLLSESLGVSGRAERGPDGSPSYTCETAEYFDIHYIQNRARRFSCIDDARVGDHFPFTKYFSMSEEEVSRLTGEEADEKLAEIRNIFAELAEYRPLEMLRTQRQRTDYLLMKQARIVAMTCTHAAIARSHLIELGFQYDNVVMEEAGQMTEVETFVPLLLQKGETDETSGLTRLKRICLIGDHNQLPPVIKNMSFSKYSNLDQSMFSRLIRLKVPYIQLDQQGRARSEIARLYSWRYNDLGNLKRVTESSEFQVANAGFVHTHQMINVEDFDGRGESTPTAYFYQNVGEAEYAVALFQYMVLIGYPANSIALLTTYNGQKDLLNDILRQRCGEGTPLANIRPKAVETVDRYQGQQAEYVILSLVRTATVGHVRDIRRLVVAVSRSRLGLYVLCRQALFVNCHELGRTMDQLSERPNKLELVVGEEYPTQRKVHDEIHKKKVFQVEDVAHLGAIVHGMQEKLLESL